MADAKLQAVLSALSPMARQLNALPSNQPGRDANCVKLNTNENPFPLPMMVLQSALAALERHYLYPEDDNLSLRDAAASAYGLSQDQVVAGNGSSELLGLIYRAFLDPGDSVAMISPGFSFNRKLAKLQGARFLEIEWGEFILCQSSSCFLVQQKMQNSYCWPIRTIQREHSFRWLKSTASSRNRTS